MRCKQHVSLSLPLHWPFFPRCWLMMSDLKSVPNLNGRAKAGWRRGNPRRKETSLGHPTGFTTLFLPDFQTKLSLCKSRYDLVFNGGEESLRCVKTPPNQEIKVKQGLSRVFTPKHSTVQNGIKTGRVGKCL